MRNFQTFDPAALKADPLWLSGGPDRPADIAVAARALSAGWTGGAERCAADRLVFVISGALDVHIGTENFVATERAVVLLPAGTPHLLGGNAGPVAVLDIMAPGWPGEALPTGGGHDAGHAASLIRLPDPSKFEGEGFAAQTLVERRTGSAHVKMNLLRVKPGAGSPDWHIHAFDQFYLILEGTMQIDIGRAHIEAPRYTFVTLPAGSVHRNWNAGSTVESHISLLVPEPRPGEIFDYAVDIHEHEAELLSGPPASRAPMPASAP